LKHVKVNSPFGTRRDPFTGAKASHNGLDLKAYYEEVYAMFDGTVKKVGADPRSGNYVVLQHGEYTISYCHLSKVRVSEGDDLIAGDVVAISGNTGRSTGSHLHITCRYKGALTDPYTLLLYIGDVRAEACTALLGEGVTADIDSISQHQRMDRKTFLSHYAPAAMEQQRQYGIPASVTLAQMAFESDWGRSDLARKGNNYFGIKCSPQWLAEGRPYSLHNDDKPDEKFCNYATVEESIDHHSRLLMSDRYKRCHSYPSTDYHHWLLALKAAGYATARDYGGTRHRASPRIRASYGLPLPVCDVRAHASSYAHDPVCVLPLRGLSSQPPCVASLHGSYAPVPRVPAFASWPTPSRACDGLSHLSLGAYSLLSAPYQHEGHPSSGASLTAYAP